MHICKTNYKYIQYCYLKSNEFLNYTYSMDYDDDIEKTIYSTECYNYWGLRTDTCVVSVHQQYHHHEHHPHIIFDPGGKV